MEVNVVSAVSIDSLCAQSSHWALLLPVSLIDESEFFLLLSGDEKNRADNFKSRKDKSCFIVAHGLKRYCLSRLINMDVGSLEFSYSDKGKPFFENDIEMDFNISHSDGWVAFGISTLGRIGVDLERSDRVVGKKTMAYALSTEQLSSLEESVDLIEEMMLYWTQKEAISKALGLGVSIGFKNINCSGEVGASSASCHENKLITQTYIHNRMAFSVATESMRAADVYYVSSCEEGASNEKAKKDIKKNVGSLLIEKLF